MLGTYAMVKRSLFGLFGKKPRTNVWIIDGVSSSSRGIRDGAATFRALDIIYNSEAGVGSNRLVRWIDWFWLHVRNAQAVRNRLEIVRSELCTAIEEHAHREQPVRILVIAAGSGQADIEAIVKMRVKGIAVEALLVDISRSALAHARKLATIHGVMDSVRVQILSVINKDGKVADFDQKIGDFNPHIVEMAGLIDYLLNEQIVALFRKIYSLLPKGGHLVTCHIHPNQESFCLLYAVNWWMRYRTRDKLTALLAEGGFSHLKLITEPHGMHTVAVGRKP